jgi:sigma-B regulation protein RsbU (phosphoserine phosphatase)
MRFFRNTQLKYLFLLAVIPVNTIASAIYTGYIYRTGEKSVMKNLDDRLLTAAYGAKFLTDPNTDRITGKNPIPDTEYKKIMLLLSDFAKKTGVEYVYTVMPHEGKIVFVFDCATQEDIERNDYSKMFEEYTDASEGLKKAAGDNRIQYDEYADKWGRHRSIFIPVTSPGGKGYILGVDIKLDDVHDMLKKVQIHALTIGLAVFAVSSLLVILIARFITQPLASLTQATAEIAGGNLDIELPPVTSAQEVTKLADAFRDMKASLKNHIKQLTETTAAKERIESELKIAHDIQMSILPKIFPPFPDKPDTFDLYAVIKPAKEVGGDFYDFFYLDDSHFCFVIGDVSGKGVPASLFMAVTKTLIKGNAAGMADPGRMLTKVNNDLSDGNDACMFVTIFFGILDTKTGEILYANGGHNPPVILNGGGAADFLTVPRDIVVGAVAGYAYTTDRVTLKPGDAIFTYTDGVTEAMNGKKELFSGKRLYETLSSSKEKTARDIVSQVMEETALFAGHAPQSDDIAMMMLQYKGEK